MKKFLLLALFPFSLNAQLNISLLGQFDYQAAHNANLSNLWGYVDEFGNEYAIVGASNGISVVNVTIPAAPVEVFFTSGTNSIWREVKTFNNYAYTTTESTDGLVIINLNPLPGAITAGDVSVFNGTVTNPFISAHSLFIDETTGILFLHGTDIGNGGVILYDLNVSATNPPEIGSFDDYYVHDSYSRGDTLYSGHISNGFFSVTDVSTPSSITYLAGNQNTPMNFTHNCWLSQDGNYLFTTDEVSGAWIGAYDVSNLTDIKEVDRIRNSETSGTIPHNTYWLNNYIITSYYRDGITIHDVTIPSNMIQVGNFDTTPLTGDGFNGAWGVYPYLPSGNILVSDIELGLFILGPTYVRACYLEGNVKDAISLLNLNTVQVDIVATTNFDQSDLLGLYSTGTSTPGSYDIIYSKAGYFSDTVTVSLVSATTVTQNVLLQPLPTSAYSGNVTNATTLAPIMGIQVLVENSVYSYTTTTDASGNFTISPFSLDTANEVYDVTVGGWGYNTFCQTGVVIDGTGGPLTVALVPGFYDDFALDFGWTNTATSSTGIWVREEPYGTMASGDFSNPEYDLAGDCSNKAYVTGNENNPSVGADDVDAGYANLVSPTFNTTGLADGYVSYYLWFRNDGGSGSPNDTIIIYLNDGSLKLVEKLTLTNFPQFTWTPRSYQVSAYTTATTNLKLEVYARDYGPGHLVEGGVDLFRVTDGNLFVGIDENNIINQNVIVYPNPTNSILNIVSSGEELRSIQLIDLTGKILMNLKVNSTNATLSLEGIANGLYSLRTVSKSGNTSVQKIIRQ